VAIEIWRRIKRDRKKKNGRKRTRTAITIDIAQTVKRKWKNESDSIKEIALIDC
jgi:hypothetical protein